MKRISLITATLLITLTAEAQTIKVHKIDGTVVTFPSSEVEYIDFSEKEETQQQTEIVFTCPDTNHPHMIDLGLPSGTKWACCNVGANAPHEFGGYYAWAETQTKNVYDWDTYQYDSGPNSYSVNIGTDIAGSTYDAATTNWGAPWCMPSENQCRELIENCTSEFTLLNDIGGLMFIGPNGGAIFLPAAGGYMYENMESDKLTGAYNSKSESWSGIYWTSTHPYIGRNGANTMEFWHPYNKEYVGIAWGIYCCDGNSVRPVCQD